MFVIHDGTPERDLQEPPGMSRGLDLSARPEGFGAYAGVAEAFPQELVIPRHEWQARVEEKAERKTRTRDLMTLAKLPAKNQKSVPYCWIFAPTHCMEIVRLKAGLPMVSLSPASAGAQIKNFRKVGGWGREGLEWIGRHGLVPSHLWPDTAVDRRYLTDDNRQVALDYRHTEWWELRDLDEYISALLHGFPVAAGYNWWSHETTTVDAAWLDGAIATDNRNQWQGYGDDNYFHLQGRRMLPDDMVCARVAIAS
jgi:hypothetical protein